MSSNMEECQTQSDRQWQVLGAGERSGLERFPASVIVSVDTDDFEEFCGHAVGWNIEYQLIGRGMPRIKAFGVMTQSLQLALVEHSLGYCSQGDTPKGSVALAVPLDDLRPMVHCGRSVNRLEMCVTRSGTGFEVVNRFGSRHLVACVSETILEKYAADLRSEPLITGHSADRLRFPAMANRQRYVEVCQTILDDVQRQPGLLANPLSASLLEERLLENILEQSCPEPRCAYAPSRHQLARRAYRYLLEQLEEAPSVRDLCAVTGASYATLERGFREAYGMAPRAYLHAVRLSRARKELCQPDKNTTVTGVAMHWGFFELGRFSVQYYQRFGESPSGTLRKARGDSSLLVKGGSRGMSAKARLFQAFTRVPSCRIAPPYEPFVHTSAVGRFGV